MTCSSAFRGANFPRGGKLYPCVWLACLFAAVLPADSARAADAGKFRVKFATLAPEGSTWMKILHDLDNELKSKTDGNVAFKFYPGGVAGDEIDVIRKMRIGQMHAAGFTGVGIGEILPEARVLDLPFLFDSDREVEYIYKKLHDRFVARFREKGYVLLGWVPVGWIHFFSQREIRALDDLNSTKAWMWEGDPLVREAYRTVRVAPYPLSVTDVLMSLQTGLVETVYASPLAAVALQWFTKVRHMSQVRMSHGTGGVLMSRDKFDALPDAYKTELTESSKKHLERLLEGIKRDNEKAVETMRKNGVALSPMPEKEELEKFHQAGETVRKNLAGSLYPRELLNTVLSHLEEMRATSR
jgi:TRAP-type C4-dicarboxylate transport system substrate-binding protein